jgi:nitrite reductase/ring-hydroxylating ferredoxin subunit
MNSAGYVLLACSGQIDLVDALHAEEFADLCLVRQFEVRVTTRDDVVKALGAQCAHDGRADQAVMAGDIDAGLRIQRLLQ